MSYFRRTVSSLDPLVFFEAAARLNSYSRAARELGVSQVAVSKRIKALEAAIGNVVGPRVLGPQCARVPLLVDQQGRA